MPAMKQAAIPSSASGSAAAFQTDFSEVDAAADRTT